MGKVRVRKETGRLYLDFFYQGIRCREQTALQDTPANRKQVEKLLKRIEAQILLDEFDYAEFFPSSRNLKKLKQQPSTELPSSHSEPNAGATDTPIFGDFADQWFEESKIEWRSSHCRNV